MFQGAKGGSSTFKQTPDNLRSNDTFEGVLGLCAGPIKGPTRGLKSVKIDGTAIENETGELNFQDFTATLGDGDPIKFPQPVQLKLGAGAAPTNIGVSLTNVGGGNPIWVTRTLANTNADYVDLRLIAQQLFRQDSKGIYNATATIEIQLKPVGKTTWINPTLGTPSQSYSETGYDIDGLQGAVLRLLLPENYFAPGGGGYLPGPSNYAITGKTGSPAVYELRIALPNEGDYADTAWDIRMRLLERESYENNTDIEKRTISWESMAAVYGDVLGEHEDWRGLAWIQLYGKASDQLTGVPDVSGTYDTKIVSVPASSIYNPETRQYTPGVWDGSWAKAFTNDPAWIINDAISDELSGLSLIASGSYLNKWDALEASKWCSQLVPDGDGGTEPRYSLNLAITEPLKAEEFIRYLAGAVGGLAFDQGDGEWRLKMDKPDVPIDIFTLDNVEGEFAYSHTDVDTRFNDIIGQFKNKEMDYRGDAVRLFDNPSIAKLGRKPTTIALVGCTGRQEALRRVKLRLRSTVNEDRIVTFTTNRRGRNVEPLSTILVADGDLGNQEDRTTGRAVAIASDRKSITVRDDLRLELGVAYTLKFTAPNTSYNPSTTSQPASADWNKPTLVYTRNVTNTSGQRGNVKTVYFDEALPLDVDLNVSIALSATDLPTLPLMYRVTSVTPQDDGERIAITAVIVDTGKWDAADNVTKEDTVFQDLRGAVPPPTTLPGRPLLALSIVPQEQGKAVNLQANWMRPAGAFISGFRIQYSVNGGALQTAVERQQFSSWELPNAAPGIYHVEVSSMDRRGGYSLPLSGNLEITQQVLDAEDIGFGDGNVRDRLDALIDQVGEIELGNGITIFFQDTLPTSPEIGDLWRTSDGKEYRFYGAGAADPLTLGDVPVTIDGEPITFPTSEAVPLLINGEPVLVNGEPVMVGTEGGTSGWVLTQLSDRLTDAFLAAAGAEAAVDGKIQCFITDNISDPTPVATALGDLWWNQLTGVMKRWSGTAWESTADKTDLVVATVAQIPQVTVQADYLGVPVAGQLPRAIYVPRYRGSDNVSATTNYSVTADSGLSVSVDNTPTDSRGLVTIYGPSILSGTIHVLTERDGVLIEREIKVVRADASAPSTGGGGGGGGGTPGGAVSVYTLGGVGNNTGFVPLCDPIEIVVGSSGNVELTMGLDYSTDSSPEDNPVVMAAKWRMSATGSSSWTDVDAETLATREAYRYFDFTTYPKGMREQSGYIAVFNNASSIPAGSYFFQPMGRVASGEGGIAGINGSATVRPL